MTPYYQDDAVTIYHGDALELLPHVGVVDLVVTDPPYAVPANHYVPARQQQMRRSYGDLSFLRHAFRSFTDLFVDALTDAGSAYVFCDGQSYSAAFEAMYPHGRVRPLVWDKQTARNGYTWRHGHELIAWLERPTANRIPTGDGDVLRFRAVKVDEREHPAEKPVELLTHLLAKHSDSHVILDPFVGGGSTLRAAKDLGRKAIGIEIEERYCEIAAKRMAQEVLPL